MKIRDWDRNLKIRLFGEAIVNLSFWMFFPFMSIYFSDSFGKEKAGLLLICSQAFSVIATLLGGYYADRVGRKRMMVLAAYGQGAAFLLFALANSPWLKSPLISFISFSLVGIFGSFYWPASQAMVADVVPEKDRNSVYAVFYTSINIAVVIGPIIGSMFYVHHLFELLLITGASSLLLGTFLVMLLNETVPKEGKKVGGGNESKWYRFLWNQVQSYNIIFRDRILMLYIIAGVLVAQTFMQLDLLIPVYAKDVIDKQTLFSAGEWSLIITGENVFGFLIAENGFLVALFTFAVTKWMSCYKDQNIFIASSIIYALSIMIFGWVSSFWGFVAGMAVFTFAELMTVGVQQGFLSKIAPEQMRAQYFAAANLRFTIGRMIAPFSITASLWIGYQWTFILLCFLALASAFIYYIMFQRIELGHGRNMAAQIR